QPDGGCSDGRDLPLADLAVGTARARRTRAGRGGRGGRTALARGRGPACGRPLPASGARPRIRRGPDASGVPAPAPSATSPVVLVDAQNVRRSTWPNIAPEELVELVGRWTRAEGMHAVVVFDGRAPTLDVGEAPVELVSTGSESADDWIAREAATFRK